MSRWPKVTLGELVSQVNRTETVDPENEYRLLGIRLEGNGPFLREIVSGTETSASRLNRVCQGDFIYSRLYAWRGAFGVINSDLDGCFVSNEFPIFRIDETQLDIAYLNRWFQLPSVWRLVEDDCSGSTPTTRNRFKEQFFCALEVPLPKLAYQKVIVNRLDQLTDKVRQVNKHLDAIETDADTLIRNYIFSLSEKGITKRKMSELVSLRQTDIIVDQLENYQFAGVYSFGRGVFASVNKAGSEFAYPRLSRVNTGDFIYPKLMAWEGALGVVPQVCDSMVVSPEFPVFTINTDAILPEIIDIYFRTPSVWPELAGISGGTNARRRRLQPSAFLNYEMPVPPMLTQLKIREMHRRVQQLKTSHKAIREANQALIPATLERLFSNATGDRKTKCN